MKVVYIILAILIIGGGAWLVFGGTDAPSTKAGETELPVNDNAAPAAETPQAEPGDTPAPADEEEIGSDVGMEYPALEDSGIDEMVVEEDDGAGDGTFPAESRTLSFSLDAFNFGFSENEIRVKEGDTVTINLTSTDGFHDWVVDEFDAATERVQTDGTTSVTFVADKAGTYEYYCSVGQHRQNGMVGTLIVE